MKILLFAAKRTWFKYTLLWVPFEIHKKRHQNSVHVEYNFASVLKLSAISQICYFSPFSLATTSPEKKMCKKKNPKPEFTIPKIVVKYLVLK